MKKWIRCFQDDNGVCVCQWPNLVLVIPRLTQRFRHFPQKSLVLSSFLRTIRVLGEVLFGLPGCDLGVGIFTLTVFEALHPVPHRKLTNTNLLNSFLRLVPCFLKSSDLCYEFRYRRLNFVNNNCGSGPKARAT